MKIRVLQDGVLLDSQSFDQHVIIIGRSHDADLCIRNPKISRKHLQISIEDGDIFIQNISEKNWLVIDGHQNTSPDLMKIFEFSTILLPDHISLEIELNPPEVTNSTTSFKIKASQTAITEKPAEFSSPPNEKIKIGKKMNRNKYIKKSGFNRSLVLFICFAIVLIFGYETLMKDAPQVSQQKIRTKKKIDQDKATSVVDKKTIKSPYIISTPYQAGDIIDEVSDIKAADDCTDHFKDLCPLLFKEQKIGNGIVKIDDQNIIVYLEFHSKIGLLFKESIQHYYTEVKNPQIFKVIAGYYLLQPEVLKRLENLGYKGVEVFVYKRYANAIRESQTFKVSTDVYRRYDQAGYAAAFKLFATHADYKAFDSGVGRWIEAVKN